MVTKRQRIPKNREENGGSSGLGVEKFAGILGNRVQARSLVSPTQSP